MIRQLELFQKWEMPGVLLQWQHEDMNRHKYPGFKGGPLPHSVSTKIWEHTHGHVAKWKRRRRRRKPRGRPAELIVVHDKKGRAHLRRKHKRRKVVKVAYEKPVTEQMRVHHGKPILRPMLFEKLRERMARNMKEKLSW